jgi:hypothetical protein
LHNVAQATRGNAGSAHAATQLLAGQTRVIHANEGLTLHVLQGRLWLTQPGDPADRFLNAGDSLELAQDWVVVEADAVPSAPPGQSQPFTAYQLAQRPLPVSPTTAANRQPWWPWRNLFGSGRRPALRLA